MPPQNLDDILKMTGQPSDSTPAAPAPTPNPVTTAPGTDAGASAPATAPTSSLSAEHMGSLDSVLQQTGQAGPVPEDTQKKMGIIEQLKKEVAGPGTVLGESPEAGEGIRRMLQGDIVGGAKQAAQGYKRMIGSATLTKGSEQIDVQKHPILKAGLEFMEGMTNPINLGMIAASGGLGMIDSAAKIYIAHQLANLGLSSQQIVDMYSRFPEVKKAWDKGDSAKVLYEGTHLLLSGVLTVAGAQDMAGKPMEVASETDRAVANKAIEGTKAAATAVKEAPGKVVAGVKSKLAAPKSTVETNPVEDLATAFPPSKTNPYDMEKAPQVAYNALAAEHKLNAVHDPREAAEALQNQISLAENKVMEGAIKQIPDEPILKGGKPISVWDEVQSELESRKISKVGFVDDAMKELEKFGLTEGQKVTVADADRIRRQLNDETTVIEKKPEYQQARIENVDPKYAALQVAKDVLRDGVYDTIDAHGLDKGVTARDFRRDIIGNLISFKNAMLDKAFGADQTVKGTAPEAPKESLARQAARAGVQAATVGAGALAGSAVGPMSGMVGAGMGAVVAPKVGEAVFPKPEIPEDLTRAELLDRSLNHPEADNFVTETPEEQQIRGNIQKPAAPVEKGQKEVPFGPPEVFGMNQGEASPLEMHPEQLDKISAYIQKLRDVMDNPSATSVEKDAAQHQIEKMFGGKIPEGFKRPKEQGAANLGAAPRLLEAREFEEPTHIKNRVGLDTKAILNHELAHAVMAHMAGLEPLDVISSEHPEARPGTVAALRVAWPQDMVKGPNGVIEPKALREHLPDVLAMYLAGGAANELYDGIKFEDNKALWGDFQGVKDTLDLLGLSTEEKDRFIEWGRTRAMATLADSNVSDLINEFSDTRERGLPESHHYSAIRMFEFKDRLNKLRGKNAIDTEGTHGSSPEQHPTVESGGKEGTETVRASEAEGVREPAARRQVGEKEAKIEGSNVQQPEWLFQQYEREIQRAKDLIRNPDAKPEEKEYAQKVLESSKALQSLLPATDVLTPPERSAGRHDEAIKQAGAVPGGIQTGDPEIEVPDLVLFHDPQTGSTLALPADKVTPENVTKQMEKSREQFATAKQKQVDQFASKMTIGYGKPEEAHEAITNTPGAKWDGEKLTVQVSRRQKPEQAGDISPRTGVFFLPEKNSRFAKHYTGKGWYGGTQKVEGQLTFDNPMMVKGATGGAAPAKAYDSIKGKGAYDDMRNDVLDITRHAGITYIEKVNRVRDILEKYSGDPDLAEQIVEVSKQGNTLPFAIQEHIVAHALRAAGHDAIVGYTTTKMGKRLSEVFDLTRKTFPSGGVLALLGLISGAAEQDEKKK